jgi:CheY-like chemotaxis protein
LPDTRIELGTAPGRPRWRPRVRPAPTGGPPEQSDERFMGMNAAMIRILVIDDDCLVRDLMRDYIREYLKGSKRPFEVVVAQDGNRALEILKRDTAKEDAAPHFDVIFLDVRMPGITGIDVYRWVARYRPNLLDRICFVTGYVGDLEMHLDPAEVSLLKKPFLLEDMGSTLTRHLPPA